MEKRREDKVYTHCRSSPHMSQPLRLHHVVFHCGGNFPTSVAARKSITAWSHFSMERRPEICTCLQLPAFQSVAFLTVFHGVCCLSLHRLHWQTRCSRFWAAVLSPSLPHHQHLSSSWCPNCYRYTPVGACPHCSR